MNSHRLAALLLLGFSLAGCGAGENEPLAYTPDPVPPELRQQATAGDAAAQFKLAEHLWPAHPADPEPLFWLRESAGQGYPVAQTSLGALYFAGDGVPEDPLEAYLWFARAAAQGDPEGVTMVAELTAKLDPDELVRARRQLEPTSTKLGQ